ncbi:MAG: type II toxin-antitoxin system HicA family toxin [Candidatus Dormibacteria bacterium]
MQWSYEEVGAYLRYLGFELARREGHDTYTREGHGRTVSVPRTSDLRPGTLGSIWRQAGTTVTAARKWRQGQR